RWREADPEEAVRFQNPTHSWRATASEEKQSPSHVLKHPSVPEDQAAPDLEEKLRPITTQEGDGVVLRAKVTGGCQGGVREVGASQLTRPVGGHHDLLRRRHILKEKPPTEQELLRDRSGANRKDAEKLCAQHGFTDFRGILLCQLKEMREEVS
ncbi:hypothetical protein NHX12_003027, partial [Muraenolepis orangiensis]